MAFPTTPDDGDTYTNALGVQYVYDIVEDKWVIISGESKVKDDVYGVGWNGDITHSPSQNAVYDKIESMDSYTKAEVDAFNAIGSGNAQWINVIFEGDQYQGNRTDINLDGTFWGISNTYWMFGVPLSTNKGSYKLYIDGVRIGLSDADGANYITVMRLYGLDYNSASARVNDGANLTTIAEHTYAFTAKDMSPYRRAVISLEVVAPGTNLLDVRSIEVKYYYAL